MHTIFAEYVVVQGAPDAPVAMPSLAATARATKNLASSCSAAVALAYVLMSIGRVYRTGAPARNAVLTALLAASMLVVVNAPVEDFAMS